MADLSVTAASVVASNQARREQGIAGATITAGQAVYADSSDSGKLKLADANLSAAAADPVGISLHGASSGQPLTYVEYDPDFTPGATLTTGVVYVLSGTAAGGIAPVADLTSGWYPNVLFIAKSTTKAVMQITHGTAAV